MSLTWQYIIVGIVVAIAFAMASRSVLRAIKHKKSALNACSSCPLKDSCTKNKPSKNCNQNE